MAVIRPATPEDLDALEDIENAADTLFLRRFEPDEWAGASTGHDRSAQPGFLFVVAGSADAPLGFVHVLEVDDGAHLEQVAVRPEAGRRGLGRALVEAALAEAAARGHDRLTLRTYAEVPWNAPFYRRLGFEESEPDTVFLRGLVEIERRLGLDRHGRRVQMTASLRNAAALPQGAGTAVPVRPVRADDEERWKALYAGYRAFYRSPEDEAAVATTWGWVSGGRHGLRGLVAVDADDRPIGLANLRVFARPASASVGLYLDDLFTAPEARGTGAGTALLERAAAIAAEEGLSVVRWITATDNATARRVYDAVAEATPWVTYDMRPSAPGRHAEEDVRGAR